MDEIMNTLINLFVYVRRLSVIYAYVCRLWGKNERKSFALFSDADTQTGVVNLKAMSYIVRKLV